MNYLFLLLALFVSSCAEAPKLMPGKGGIYGILSADSHPEFIKKMESDQDSGSMYQEMKASGVKYQDNMVNYSRLSDLYVGLVQVNSAPRQHQMTATSEIFSPASLALAVGDTIRLRNETGRAQHFFVAESAGQGDRIQAFPPLAPGAVGDYKIELSGDLELLSEDNERLKARLLAEKGLLSRRVASGGQYQFADLDPGSYQLVFWYWRLGKIRQTVSIKANENVRVDKVLNVDSVIKAN